MPQTRIYVPRWSNIWRGHVIGSYERKTMALKKATLQALSVVTTVGLALGVAAPASAGDGAKDLPSDNAQKYGRWRCEHSRGQYLC